MKQFLRAGHEHASARRPAEKYTRNSYDRECKASLRYAPRCSIQITMLSYSYFDDAEMDTGTELTPMLDAAADTDAGSYAVLSYKGHIRPGRATNEGVAARGGNTAYNPSFCLLTFLLRHRPLPRVCLAIVYARCRRGSGVCGSSSCGSSPSFSISGCEVSTDL